MKSNITIFKNVELDKIYYSIIDNENGRILEVNDGSKLTKKQIKNAIEIKWNREDEA